MNEFSGRPTWAEINLKNLAYNLDSVKNFINKNVELMAVIKADAYGHCAVECARKLEETGINWFGVALPEEGLELRKNGISKPILCLGGFWKGQEESLLRNDLTPVIYQIEKADLYNQAAKHLGVKAKAHLKVDTGMGRIGVRFDEIEKFSENLKVFDNLDFEGIMTHFAAADSFGEKDFTNLQIERFNRVVEILENKNFEFKYKDLANSPAAIAHPKSYGNMIRLGGILYGLGEDVLPDWTEKPKLKPVLSLYTQISLIKNVKKGETLGYGRTFQAEKDSIVATIPIGYQDGYRRALSNRGRVLVKGKYADVVGRISMDWTIINITEIENVNVGDEVVLIGEQNGSKITTEEIAQKAGTISYEITCGLNKRVTRKYVDGE